MGVDMDFCDSPPEQERPVRHGESTEIWQFLLYPGRTRVSQEFRDTLRERVEQVRVESRKKVGCGRGLCGDVVVCRSVAERTPPQPPLEKGGEPGVDEGQIVKDGSRRSTR